MALTTTNIEVTPAAGWVAIGNTTSYVAIQHLHKYKELEMSFGAVSPSLSTIGHPLPRNTMESGILGSQLWVRSPEINITVIVTVQGMKKFEDIFAKNKRSFQKPQPTYVNGVLYRMDYGVGKFKVFEYNAEGLVISVTTTDGGIVTVDTVNWIDGVFNGIT